MKKWKKFGMGFLVLGLWVFPVSLLFAQSLETRVKFLEDIDNVDWYKVYEKNIIIGWRGLPDNFYGWNHRTAVKASLASLYEVKVWSVRHRQKSWLPGKGGHICVTTAKSCRFGKSNCKK